MFSALLGHLGKARKQDMKERATDRFEQKKRIESKVEKKILSEQQELHDERERRIAERRRKQEEQSTELRRQREEKELQLAVGFC